MEMSVDALEISVDALEASILDLRLSDLRLIKKSLTAVVYCALAPTLSDDQPSSQNQDEGHLQNQEQLQYVSQSSQFCSQLS